MRLNNHQRRRISLGVKRYVELPKTVTNNAEKRENIRSQKCQTVSQYNTIQYNTVQYNTIQYNIKQILLQIICRHAVFILKTASETATPTA